ncbi:CehA/McbA family metallohydrolase [Clostridium sp.]|uniref:CehA/McbA family metallohydrolase n=1 Tax=Clostridium sp. TaxID=1506 RepID=UPI0032165A38
MGKKNNKLLSLISALLFLVTYIVMPSINVYALEKAINNNVDTTILLSEGFTGARKNVKPEGTGWIITRNGEEATVLDGYDTSGNYGKEKPSLGFGRLSGSSTETLETPVFNLNSTGTLSFWYRGQAANGPITSTFKLEAKVNDAWKEIKGPDITVTSESTFSVSLEKEVTAVRFTFNKASGNLAIDDIKITCDGGGTTDPEEPLVDPPNSEVITIAAARALSNGTEAVVRGVVSFNDRNQTLHIQDATGAIAISNNSTKIDLSAAVNGALVEVKGKRDTFRGVSQLQASDIKVISNSGMPASEIYTIKELLTGNYDSKYVEITNAVIDVTAKTLTQGEDKLDIYYVPSNINVVTGDLVNVKGTMGKYNTTVQIYGSSCTFTKVEAPDTEGPIIKHEPVVKASIDEALQISASIEDNKEVKSAMLNYRAKGEEIFKAINMIKDEQGNYTGLISKEELNLKGIEYYLVAEDGTNTTRIPQEGVFLVEVTNADIVGPEIYDLVPDNGASIGDVARPEIKASIKDRTGVDKKSIKMFFDGEEITSKATITATSILYKPASDLADGSHIVKVEAKDTLGNSSTKEWSFKKGKLTHYFGQLHSHTNISDGTGSLDEAYTWAKNHGADYYAVTDHSNWFDNDTAATLADGSASKAWTNAHVTADEYDKADDFTAIYGYEMTWSGSTGGWGHMNTFNTPGFETRSNKAMDLQNYYNTLQTQPQSISQLNHPGKTFGDFADFGYYSAGADKVVNLVEVGNGEGPIRGSGYFPSYEYYTRALDKGWHVAPTNNQDNHKGKWYTSNTARTVIISTDNSREALYDSMRNLNVYASEDENMTIDYTVNGSIMGSSLGEVDKLNFKVNIADDDAIKKVSVISNGGVEVTSKDFNSKNVDWQFELSPEYTYYYLKIVQGDEDIAVTAPVWVGDSSNFGLTAVTVDNEITLPNEKVQVSVGVYNNESTALKDAKVEFFVNEIKTENKIGEKVIPLVEGAKTENVQLDWTPTKQGEYTIYAKATINHEGSEKVFTNSVKVKVKNPENTYKVVIDGAHVNQYVSGNYAGKYTALKNLLQDRNTILSLNKEPITADTLKGIDLFILTDPQSIDKSEYNLTKSKLEPSEIKAIADYVKGGGNIIVTTIADYKDGEGEYSNDKQLNPLLEAIGTELRINDDQVIDNTTNGGQPYRLYFNKYSSPLYNLVSGIEDGKEQYSFYSGASVVLADGAKGDKVDFLVKGYETTTTSDADNDKDNVPVEQGKVSVIGAEELSNGGKVVVAGNTFFSDFETDGQNATSYSNIKIVKNIMGWMMPEKVAEKVNIEDVRIDANKDNVPDLLGEEFTIEGIVTSQSEAVTPKNSFFEVVYIEDETGGICIFGVSKTPLRVGQKIRVTGTVDAYQGEFEIQVKDEDAQIQILDENPVDISPVKLSTGNSMLTENGGKLIQVQGKVVRMDKSNLYINDGTGESRIYVEGYIWDGKDEATKGAWDKSIKVGDTVSAIGLGSMDPEGTRLRVRNTGEIVLIPSKGTNEKSVINGAEDITIKVGDSFDPKSGVTATDKEDGDITSRIVIKGSVDTSKAGEYVLTYSITDSDGNTTTMTRKITVVGGEKPETPSKPNKPSKPSNPGRNTSKLPKTGGDSSSIVLIVIAVLVIGGGVTLLFKRKNKGENTEQSKK